MRTAILLIWASLLLEATTVTGTIRLPDQTNASGRAYIRLSGQCIGAGGAVVAPKTKIVTITNGALSVALEPSATCVPQQVYRVVYQLTDFNAPEEFWNVPDSGTPVTIASVRVASIPVNPGAIGIGYLTGLTCKGDIVGYTGTSTVRIPCPTAPNQVLKYDAGAASGVSWQADGGGGGAAYGRYSATMASASSWSIPGATHGLGTCALAVALWVGGLAVEAGTTSCNPTTFDVTIPFTSAVAGDVFLSSDPVLVTDSPWAGSLVSQVVAQSVNSSTITINHNLNGVVLLRCYTGTNQRLGFNVGTVVSANSLTVDFIGSVAGSSYCIAAR